MSKTNRAGSDRTWIISEVYWPEETGTGYFMTGLAEGLASRVKIGVICGQPTYSRRGIRAPRRESHRNVAIRRVRSTTFHKDSTPGRLANMVTMTASLAFDVLRTVRRGERVVVVTNPPVLPYAVAAVCRLRRLPYTVVVHDMFPYHLLAAGVISPESTVATIAPVLNRWLYEGAASITVLGRDLAERIRGIVATDRAPIGIVTSWADIDRIRAHDRCSSRLLRDLGLLEKFVVQYAGNIGPLQDIPTILDAMEIVAPKDNVHLLVVGDGGKRQWLEREIETRGLANITVIDPVPRDQADEVHQACDIAIVSLIRGMLGVAVPSRTYNFLAAGRPIVAAVHPQSEIGRLIDQQGVGWVTGAGDSDALAAAILDAAEAPDQVAAMGRKARDIAVRDYSQSRVIDRMAALLDGTLDDSPVALQADEQRSRNSLVDSTQR